MLLGVEIAVIIILVLANGVLALAETAILSSRKTLLEKWAQRGNVGARTSLILLANITSFLSSVQVGITLLGILAGVFSGAALSEQLTVFVGSIAPLQPYAPELSFVIVVLAVTAASVLFGELVPKRLALKNPERIASFVSRPVFMFTRLTSPFARMLSGATELIVSKTSRRLTVRSPVSEEEVRMIIDQGIAAGVFEPTERDIITRVFRLGDLRVNDLMVHRTEIEYVRLGATMDELALTFGQSPRDQYPVCEGTIDQIIGIIYLRDIVTMLGEGTPDLRAALREPLFLPETMTAFQALDALVKKRIDTAIVVDEFGGTAGLVRVQDVTRALVGEGSSSEESPSLIPELQPDGSLVVDGRMPLHQLAHTFPRWFGDGIPSANIQTIGGLVMTSLGRLPIPGDEIVIAGVTLRVLSMRENRVGSVSMMSTGSTLAQASETTQ